MYVLMLEQLISLRVQTNYNQNFLLNYAHNLKLVLRNTNTHGTMNWPRRCKMTNIDMEHMER